VKLGIKNEANKLWNDPPDTSLPLILANSRKLANFFSKDFARASFLERGENPVIMGNRKCFFYNQGILS
jgi:hypothetical protein